MKTIINNILEWIGYHFVGYKVDIKHLEKTINKLKEKHLNDLSELLAFDNKLDNKINNTLDWIKQLEKNLTDRVNDINSLVLTNKDEISYINNELDAMSEKVIYGINLELDQLREIVENNDKRIDWIKEDTKRKIKVKTLQTPFKSNNDCGVCDEFILKCAEQQTELDELKQIIKEVENTINLTNEKE